jgi:transcriptional regulator with XRE-family HTH domain
MDLKEIMAVNLRRKRQELDMTQEDLAERAGLSARYVGKLERAEVAASVTVLGKIAEALELEPGDLFKRLGRGSKPAKQKPRPDGPGGAE